MGSFLRQHPGATMLSVAMHLAIFAAFAGLHLSPSPRGVRSQPAIKATVVDPAAVEREVERIEQAERAESEKREREAREAQAAADKAKREREAEERRLEQAKRDREEAEAAEKRRQIALKEQREREAREQREREEAEARERKRKEEEEKQRRQAEADARKQAELEDELQRALAAEDERRQAEEAGLLDEYIRLIQNKIERSWIKPPSAKPGLECVINVTQIPSGDVVGVGFGPCNADEAVKRSIEAAVLRASPLPRPPVPSLFSRSLEITFRPEV